MDKLERMSFTEDRKTFISSLLIRFFSPIILIIDRGFLQAKIRLGSLIFLPEKVFLKIVDVHLVRTCEFYLRKHFLAFSSSYVIKMFTAVVYTVYIRSYMLIYIDELTRNDNKEILVRNCG